MLASVHQVCEALVAVVIGMTIDQAVVPGDSAALAGWVGTLVALFVVLALAGAVGYYRLGRAEQRIAHDLRVKIAERVVDERGGTEGLARTGEVLSLSTSDALRVGSVAEAVGGAASAIAALAGGVLYLLVASWELGLVVLVGLPVVVIAAQRLAEPLIERSTAEQEAVAHASGVATDLITGLRVLKGIGAEAAGSARYRVVSRAARDGRIHAARYMGLYESATLAIGWVFVVLIAWLGGRLAMSGAITIGQLVAAAGMAAFLVFPLQRITALSADLAVVRASSERIAGFLAAPPAVADGTDAVAAVASGRLTLDGVVSGTLRGLDLAVAPGEWLGVVATDQRDALSLRDLLGRRADPQAGSVCYGEADVRTLLLHELRGAVVVADHGAVLFDGTVGENVAVEQAPGVHLARVLAATTADQVTAVLPAGAASPVGESGRWLSGGQRQRVALARAVATGASVLVLHEPTTAVDAATEAAIAAGLRALRARQTTVVIATSPAWMAVCDRIIVICDGVVVGEDSHVALTRRDARYRAAVLT